MTVEHEVRAVLAERVAAAFDRAANRGDETALLKASDKLLELLDTLPVRDVAGGGAAGDGGDDRRSAALRLLDSPPEVGDAAHS
jgi:hypothetical protein